MIPARTFAIEMSALAERFGRTISDDMLRRYREHIGHLDESTFLDAARTIYRDDTFWPPPARFLELAGTATKTRAEAAWNRTLTEVRNGEAPALANLDPAHAAALRAVGKHRGIGTTREDRLGFLKRDFLAAYQDAAEPRPELEAPPTLELEGAA